MKDMPTDQLSSEGQAIALAQRGDHAAFEYIYKAYCKRVYSVCLRMIRNPAEAEELTQQTFLQLFRKIGTFRSESNFSTWLYRVTVNVVLLHMRHRKPAAAVVEDLEQYTANEEGKLKQGSGGASRSNLVDRINLKRAISVLSPGCKQQFILYDVLGYKHSEIAERLGCSVSNSKSQLHKARKRLRRLLQGEPGGAKTIAATA
jgi:RNA polymerase sigma-70 factor (ECF subfamily)